MKEKVLNFLKSNLLFAVVLNTIILVFCIQVSSFSFDSISEFSNSVNISDSHFYYSSSINYILSSIIGSVQYAFPNFNCYVLAQILLSFVSFISITYVFANKYNKKKSLLISLIINILFSLEHYANIHSSKTSAILLAAGFLLILNAIHNKKYNLPCWIGCCEIAFGSFFNFFYFFIALGFAFAFFVGDLISKKKYKIPFRKFFWYFRPFMLMFAFVVLLVLGLFHYSYSVNHATSEAENYYKYSELTDSIKNYPFPSYNSHKEEFNTVGISTENDYELLKNGYYDSEKSLDNNALELVSKIQQQERTDNLFTYFENIYNDIHEHLTVFDCYAILIIAFVCISVLFICFQKRRFTFFPFLYLIVGLISSLVIRYYFSGENFMIYGIWLMMYLFLLYSLNFDQARPRKNKLIVMARKRYGIIASVCVIGLFASYCVVFQNNLPIKTNKSQSQAIFTEINRNPDKMYVLDVPTSVELCKHLENYIHPLWGFRKNYLSNVDSFEYFHDYNKLHKRNLPNNIYEAVLTNNKIYVIDKNITFRKERYFTQNYANDGQFVVYNWVKDVGEYKIYEVKLQ